MGRKLTIRKLNVRGFDHVFMVVAFVVVIGVIGTGYLLFTNAYTSGTWTGSLELNSTGVCLNAPSFTEGAYVTVDKCNSSSLNQKWQLAHFGTVNGHDQYKLETYAAGTFQCVDDWGQSTSTHQNYLRLYPCATGGNAVLVYWSYGENSTTTHQLVFGQIGGGNDCLDDYQQNLTSGTRVDLYGCKTASTSTVWNQEWIEGANSASAGGGSTSGGGGSSGLQSGSQGLIYASVGNNLCLAQTGSEIVLATCNSGNTSDEWVQLSSTGAGTEVFQNVSSHSYLGAANENVGTGLSPVATQGSNTTDWTASGNGPNTLTIGVMTTTPAGNDAPCMSAPNGTAGAAVVLAACDPTSSNQQFSLPVAFSSSSSSSSSNSSSGNCTFAATASACQSELNSGSGSSSSSSSSSSGSTDDLTALLNALKSYDPSFTCTSLSSTSDVTACDQVFGQ